MPLNAERAGEFEVGLDFPQGRGDTLLFVMSVDEIEDLSLAGGKSFVHTCTNEHVMKGWQTPVGKSSSETRKSWGCRELAEKKSRSRRRIVVTEQVQWPEKSKFTV